MRRFTRLVVVSGILVVAVAAVGLILFLSMYPDVDPPADLTIHPRPSLIARGTYLANHVAVCMDCHSTRNWDYYSGPIIPGTEGKGGEKFGPGAGFPGTIYASNITSESIGHWTDGEILRAITSGVSRDGGALFPIMPYPAYNMMAEEDVFSIVTYIRTLGPRVTDIPERSLDFPIDLFVRTIPMRYEPKLLLDSNNPLVYGKYLTTIAACAECHTPQERGKKIPGMDFAGGFELPLPDGSVVRAANITPDNATGIGRMEKEDFIARFKMYKNQRIDAKAQGKNTIMPWVMYAGMTQKDLGSIYTYLRTVKPVRNMVEMFPEQAPARP